MAIELSELVNEEALREFKSKYDDQILKTTSDIYISGIVPKDSDILGTKGLKAFTSGLSFGQDENGRWGYRTEANGSITPFGNNGYNGYHGVLWMSGYISTTDWGTTPPGTTLISNFTDIVDVGTHVYEDNTTAISFQVYEGCRLRFTSFSNYGRGSGSQIKNKFTIFDARTGEIIEDNVNLLSSVRNFQGYEEIVMKGAFQCNGTAATDKYAFAGGWQIEIVSVNSDYIQKPKYINRIVFNQYYGGGDGEYKSFGSSLLIDGVGRGSKIFAISSAYGSRGGYTGGSSCGINLNGNSIGGSIVHEINNGDNIIVSSNINYFGSAWAHVLVFSMPASSAEGRIPNLVKTIGRFVKNSNETVTENYKDAWTIEGLTSGRNAFVMWTGSGSLYVNGGSLSSTKARLVHNGDVIIKYLTVPPGGRPTSGYAYVFEI